MRVAADSTLEAHERFEVSLTNATGGASIGRAMARGDILNDDGSRYSIGPATAMVAEGTGGTSTATFTVHRAGTSAGIDTLDWAVSSGSMPGTLPVAANDFAGGMLPSGTVTFAPGQATATILIPIAADPQREFNESFEVTLSNPSAGAAIGRSSASGAIIDDDTIVVLGTTPVSGTASGDYFLILAGDHNVSALGGVDRFVFSAAVGTAPGSNVTTLADFAPLSGERIDLRQIDAIAADLDNDLFSFIGAAAFSGTAGELRAVPTGATVLIAGDTDGDGLANFQIVAGTTQTPSSSWFLL